MARVAFGQNLLRTFLNLADQACILHDRHSVLREFLSRLARRLRELGACRVRTGGGYYWELKPDYEWGERIEL